MDPGENKIKYIINKSSTLFQSQNIPRPGSIVLSVPILLDNEFVHGYADLPHIVYFDLNAPNPKEEIIKQLLPFAFESKQWGDASEITQYMCTYLVLDGFYRWNGFSANYEEFLGHSKDITNREADEQNIYLKGLPLDGEKHKTLKEYNLFITYYNYITLFEPESMSLDKR